MKPSRRKTLIVLLGVTAAALLAALAITNRSRVLEQWYLWRLGSDDIARRLQGAEGLAAMRSIRAVDPLARILGEDEEWRFENYPDSPSFRLPRNFSYAAEALIEIGTPAAGALEKILRRDERGAEQAAYALLAIARDELSRGQNDSATAIAAPALTYMVQGTRLTGTHPTDQRMYAAKMLGGMGPDAAVAIPQLTRVLRYESSGLQRAAALALIRIGPAASGIFLETIEDPNLGVRIHAANALGRIRPTPIGARPALVKALRDPDASVRRYAALSLGKIASKDETDILNALKQTLEDDDVDVRDAALGALQKLEKDETAPRAASSDSR